MAPRSFARWGGQMHEVAESLVNRNSSGVGQIRRADFQAQTWLRRGGEPSGGRASVAGSDGRLSRSEPGRGEIADQAGSCAAGASGARMLGGSLATERRSCRATSIALIE